MSQWNIIVKNISGIPQTVEDLGIIIDSTAELNLDEIFTYEEIAESNDLKNFIINSDFSISDGTSDLTITQAIDYLTTDNLYYLKENYYNKYEIDNQLLDKNTLDEAYDEGGLGSGRIINATNGAVKIDTGVATNAPLELTEKNSLPTTGLSSGQLAVKNGIVFIYDGTRSKWLSITRMFLVFGKSGNTKNQYLYFYAGSLPSNNSGLRLSRSATIVSLSGQFDGVDTGTFEIRKNDGVFGITSLTVTSAIGNHDNTINIDLNEGDYLQSYFSSNEKIQDPMIIVEIAWRG